MLCMQPGTTLPSESLFCVTVRLTEEGVPRWREAVGLIFHYLHIVRSSEEVDRERLWREVKTMSLLNFKWVARLAFLCLFLCCYRRFDPCNGDFVESLELSNSHFVSCS